MTSTALVMRANVNSWIGENFPKQRKYISHSNPTHVDSETYRIDLQLKNDGDIFDLGVIEVQPNEINLIDQRFIDIEKKITEILEICKIEEYRLDPIKDRDYEFHYGDGISSVASMADYSLDLLLTDPPYSISKSYVCEQQVPRRLRKNGSDFIMPKGNFGDWDNDFKKPKEWTKYILPKVRGWAVIFCSHSQIGEYCQILNDHKFVAVTPMVWHKTNPVPFNHKYKPINAWEALVVGKRAGTKFNGRIVHNVFTHKSPSPQTRIHSTQKPDGLLQEFVKLFSNYGDTVVDPFAGSGSTIVAAVKEGRKALAYENDPAIFDKAVKRTTEILGSYEIL